MRGVVEHYYQLLETSIEAFAGKLFIVSYHALAGAMYCAMELGDPQKKDEVAKLAVEQFEGICKHYSPSLWDEQLEVFLYRSLVRIADPYRRFRQDSA